jgi:hypothetical protein
LKKILIISPHYPPSNLAAVHRSRLFAQHLPSFGWEPVILTVDEKYYEEQLDWNLHKLLPENQHIEKVNAFKVSKPRLIGDIGLRAFFQLRTKALQIVQKQQIDFVLIPIPSFYVSLIGPYLHRKTGVKYGIDYIDPWVHTFPGSEKKFSRHWWSTKLSKWLEPKAVKKASVIMGVAEGYYSGVIERNPSLKNTCVFGAMPYGGEAQDHENLTQLNLKPYLFKKRSKMQFIYAGAMLPKAYKILEIIFKVIHLNPDQFNETEFHFIGTGKTPDDENGFNIKRLAEKYDLWGKTVFEYPKRIPYLDVLAHLAQADAVFILGSTEPHYTPSKTYQGVLSKKPLFAILHTQSSAVSIIRGSNAGIVLDFNGENELNKIESSFVQFYHEFLGFCKHYSYYEVNTSVFNQFSASTTTEKLTALLNSIY